MIVNEKKSILINTSYADTFYFCFLNIDIFIFLIYSKYLQMMTL